VAYVTAADAWVELISLAPTPVTPDGWRIVVDGDDDPREALDRLWRKNPKQAFSPTGTLTLGPGDRLVARLTQSRHKPSIQAVIQLFDELGQVRDELDLGKDSVPDGATSSLTDEAVALCPDLTVLNDGSNAWIKTTATPGAANLCDATTSGG
jgi:hypothetical protein